MEKKKVILFGGTFDPIHLGHIAVVKAADKKINADKVLLVPAKQTALKSHLPLAADRHRLEMIKLAIAGCEKFSVSDYELNKPAPAYTLDTVLYFKAKYENQADIYWLIGADCLDDLHRWYKIEKLVDECFICIMYRGGFEKPDLSKYADLWTAERIEKLRQNIIETPQIDISSTQIRKALSEGKDVSSMLDDKVLEYIKQNKLYGT